MLCKPLPWIHSLLASASFTGPSLPLLPPSRGYIPGKASAAKDTATVLVCHLLILQTHHTHTPMSFCKEVAGSSGILARLRWIFQISSNMLNDSILDGSNNPISSVSAPEAQLPRSRIGKLAPWLPLALQSLQDKAISLPA